jgi:phospholipase C
MKITRREFIAGAAAGAAGAASGALASGPAAAAARTLPRERLPRPESSGIDHIVVVMMENRSFDHYLGWLRGAAGRQRGLTYTDKAGVAHTTYHLLQPSGCGFMDPDHSYEGGRIQLDHGLCDGWLRANSDLLAIGYYESKDLDFYRRAARDWTVCDHYFAATLGPTFPNRLYQHAAQTDRISNTLDLATMPTIWDRLADKNIPAAYFFSDLPVTALWGAKYLGISHPIAQFYASAELGTLPAVSFIDPRFLGEDNATSNDDHPLADIRAGQFFLNTIYEALAASPNWERTVLVINYDEWGGFFDHVVPPIGPDPRPDLGTDGTGQRGFRVPCLVISPMARRGVARGTFDHTSVLKMIEWRFGLDPLTVRDAAARNLAEVLHLRGPHRRHAPRYDVPDVATPGCPATGTSMAASGHPHHGETWEDLRDLATAHGFGV